MTLCVNGFELPLRELAVIDAQRSSQHVNELARKVMHVTPSGQAVLGVPVPDELNADAVALALNELPPTALLFDVTAHGIGNGSA